MSRIEEYLFAQVKARPNAPALTDSLGNRWTYTDLDTAAKSLGTHLQSAGAVAGDRIMIVSENCAAAIAGLYAGWLIGAIAVPVNARQSTPEIDRIIAHATPRCILFTSQVSTDAARHSDRLDAQPLTGSWGTLDVAIPHESAPDSDSEVAVLLYTTGTTGDPKGVMLTHDNVRFGARTSANLRQMTTRDLIYGVLPTTHVFGLCSVVLAAIYAGAPFRLVPRFDVAAVYEGLRDGVTLFSAVPQMHALIMAHVKSQGLDQLGALQLRYVSSGAAPLDPTWKREAETFYGVALQNGYGMTESTAGAAATRNSLGDPDTSVGPALPGVEIAIDQSIEGGGDGMGEVLTRGPHVMKGYFRNASETAKMLDAEGWLHTGDLGRLDDKGHLHILGRFKELIIHGGFNVYPPEVEAALNDHPEVIQAAVVGRRKGADEEVLAFVQIAPDCPLTAADLTAFVKPRLAGYKCPAQIVLATSLPAAPTGKILKHKLIDAFSDVLD